MHESITANSAHAVMCFYGTKTNDKWDLMCYRIQHTVQTWLPMTTILGGQERQCWLERNSESLWRCSQPYTSSFASSLQKSVDRWDKCLNKFVYFIEKWKTGWYLNAWHLFVALAYLCHHFQCVEQQKKRMVNLVILDHPYKKVQNCSMGSLTLDTCQHQWAKYRTDWLRSKYNCRQNNEVIFIKISVNVTNEIHI